MVVHRVPGYCLRRLVSTQKACHRLAVWILFGDLCIKWHKIKATISPFCTCNAMSFCKNLQVEAKRFWKCRENGCKYSSSSNYSIKRRASDDISGPKIFQRFHGDRWKNDNFCWDWDQILSKYHTLFTAAYKTYCAYCGITLENNIFATQMIYSEFSLSSDARQFLPEE